MRQSARAGLIVLLAVGLGWAEPSYQVRLVSLSRVHVDATFDDAPNGKLFMETGASGRDDGFASFVENMSAASADGAPFLLRRDAATWTFPGSVMYPIHLSYDVDLSFVTARWPVGNEQAGYTDGKATFLVTKALFLDSAASGRRTVRFSHPENWRVVTPWTRTGDTFAVSSSEDLLRNTMVFGEFISATYLAPPFSFEIVAFGTLTAQQSRIRDALATTVRECVRLFPGTPETQFLVTLLPGTEDDGEAYSRGFASTLKVPLQDWQSMVWLNTMAHELTHYWIGGLLRTAKGMDWFDEGFTDYYANLALVRGGALTPQQFVLKMERHLAAYSYFMSSPLYSGVAIQDAGQRKGSFRFGVYDGGWTVAWALDLKIRQATHNHKSLDDVMRLVFDEFRRSDAPISLAGIRSAASSVLGTGADDFFAHFVVTRNEINVADLLDSLEIDYVGQSYAGELYLRLKARPSQLRRSWAGF